MLADTLKVEELNIGAQVERYIMPKYSRDVAWAKQICKQYDLPESAFGTAAENRAVEAAERWSIKLKQATIEAKKSRDLLNRYMRERAKARSAVVRLKKQRQTAEKCIAKKVISWHKEVVLKDVRAGKQPKFPSGTTTRGNLKN